MKQVVYEKKNTAFAISTSLPQTVASVSNRYQTEGILELTLGIYGVFWMWKQS